MCALVTKICYKGLRVSWRPTCECCKLILNVWIQMEEACLRPIVGHCQMEVVAELRLEALNELLHRSIERYRCRVAGRPSEST